MLIVLAVWLGFTVFILAVATLVWLVDLVRSAILDRDCRRRLKRLTIKQREIRRLDELLARPSARHPLERP